MKRNKIGAAALFCAVGVGIAALQCGLTVRRYTVSVPKGTGGRNLRIVMLSDLHSYVYPQNQQPLLAEIRRQSPDVIALCGDIIDDKAPEAGAFLLLTQLSAIAPCFYVSGNHEWWSGHAEEMMEQIENCGITVLRGESVDIAVDDTIYRICGIDDPASTGSGVVRSYGTGEAFRAQLADAFGDLQGETVNVLLAHRPEYIADYAALPFDLTLCGHAHGGQWRIPYLLNGLIAPNQGFFPQYAGGAYEYGGMTEIVGRGLVRDWKPRIFNPPELVVVDVKTA